jgi:inner membrane protein
MVFPDPLLNIKGSALFMTFIRQHFLFIMKESCNRKIYEIENEVTMPTVFTHPVVPIAIGAGFGKKIIAYPLLMAGIFASVLPDLDVVAFKMGIPYAAAFGHRGFSHSLMLAFLFALVCSAGFRYFKIPLLPSFLFLFVSGASHGLLDTLTNGGLGIALLWPFSDERYFAPVQVIQVSPINPARFFSKRAVNVLLSEGRWVWLPCFILFLSLLLLRWGNRLRKD